MQGMAKFMEQCACVIIAQQRGRAFGKVTDIDHHRALGFGCFRLTTHRRTPRPRAFGGSCKIIPDEHRHMTTLARDLPGAAITVIKRHVQGFEFQPKKPVRTGKNSLDHPVKLQVGFQLGLIEVKLGAAAFLGIIAPVPGGQIIVHAVGLHHPCQDIGIRFGAGFGRCPHIHQQIAHSFRCFGHFSFQLERSKAVIAQQMAALFAQGQRFSGDGAIVSFAAIGAARFPGAECFFSQGAAGRKLQKRHNQRAR